MRSIVRASSLVVVGLVLSAVSALAVGQARMYGLVKNQVGEPVPEAKITITCPELPSFKLELVSNKQGKYTVALVDATKSYVYTVEKEGFQTLSENVKISIGSNTSRDFTLMTAQQAYASAVASGAAPAVDPSVETFNAGVALLTSGDRSGALAKFASAVEINPELGAAWAAMGTVYLQDKKFAEAAAAADKAVALDGGDTRALRTQVDAYRALGDKVKGDAAAAALAAADPAAGAVDLFNQGVEVFNAGKTAEATALFESAVAADASYARAHYMLGLCYSGTDSAKAKESFKKFIELAPDDPDAATAKEMLGYL